MKLAGAALVFSLPAPRMKCISACNTNRRIDRRKNLHGGKEEISLAEKGRFCMVCMENPPCEFRIRDS